jgi:putative ABC transport system ATP-binding protein
MVDMKTTEYESVSAMFERLTHLTGASLEQTELRRAIGEAVAATPGEVKVNWARWFLDAGRAVSLKFDEFTASSNSAFDLVASGVSLLAWHGTSQRFLLVTKDRQGNVVTQWSDSTSAGTRTSPRKLAKLIANGDRQQPIHWVAVGSGSLQHEEHAHGHHVSPLNRFWQMLRPEMSDIGVLFVIGLVIALLATAVPIAGQQLVRTVTFGTLYQPIVVLSLLLLACLGFMGALQTLNVFVVELIQQRLFARTVADLSLRLPRADFQSLRQTNGPELINRFLDIATVQKVVAGLLVDGLAVVLTTVIGMTLLAFYHPFLLGYDLLLLGLLLFVVLVMGRGGTQTAIRESIEKYRILAWLEDVVRCPLAFRLAGGADFALARADRLTADYLAARRSHFQVLLRQILSLFAIQALASTTLLGLGGYLVMHEQLTLGQLVAAELIVTMIVSSFAKLAKHIEAFFDLMAAMDKLGHLTDIPLEHGGTSLRVLADAPLAEIRSPRFVWSQDRSTSPQFNQVTESLVDSNRPSQSDHEPTLLLIASGQHTAVWGVSGSGKSLLADMLFGLEAPDGGTVQLGGCDVRELSPDVLRRHVALIRSVEILAGTIEENIHLGRTNVDGAVIREALRTVSLHEEVASLPQGLGTVLVSDGSPLSDSQQVRLMIARAIAGQPKLLVIDGLLDRLPSELIDPLLSNLQSNSITGTLLILTGRHDLASRLPRTANLMSHR